MQSSAIPIMEEEEEEEEQINGIPELSDDLLIRIFSLLPVEEIARAKSVSKAWHKLLLSGFCFLPPLTFEPPRHYNGTTISSFFDAIDSSLKLHYEKHLPLSKLRHRLDLKYIGSWRSKIDSWIDAALEMKVGHLHLCFPCHYINPYLLPVKVLSSRTIRVLCLEECRLEICGDINIDLPALRKLCLRGIWCNGEDEQAIQKLISSCPLIQDLKISSCNEMRELHVSGLVNLQRLSVVSCMTLRRIEIDAPSLQYLDLLGSFWFYMVSKSCEFLRELILYDRYITKNLLSRFPNLERLEINDTLLGRIEISHRRLKQLDLSLTKTMEAILKIDTPNLQSFRYYGYKMPLISVISSLNPSSLQEVDINFINSRFSILQSKEFFEMMKHCQDIKLNLHIRSKQELIIPKKLRPILSPPVYDIKHLHLLVYNCCRYQFIIDHMFWMCHPQILSFSRDTEPRFLKVLYNKFRNKEDHPKCCISRTTRCWRHYLEEVQIDGDESRAEIDRIIAMTELYNTDMKCEVRLRLKWRC